MANELSRTRTFFEGAWHDGNPGLIGPRSHAMWLGSCVFDGARWFDGAAPDLDLHCERVNGSARGMNLEPTMTPADIARLTLEGVEGFDGRTAIYVRPMYWAEAGGFMGVSPDAASTRFCLCLYEAPMLEPSGFTLAISPFRKPTPESAPTLSKAGCLYPNNGRALLEARSRGFDNALMLDQNTNVAETGTSNVFMAKDGIVFTPAPNRCFLNGVTRQRVIALLREAGRTVVECALTVEDFMTADEIFSTGNHSKVVPVTALEKRAFQAGPVYREAREAYWAYAGARLPEAA